MSDFLWLQAIHGAWHTYQKTMNKKRTATHTPLCSEKEIDKNKTIEKVAEAAFVEGFSAGAQHAMLFAHDFWNYEAKLN